MVVADRRGAPASALAASTAGWSWLLTAVLLVVAGGIAPAAAEETAALAKKPTPGFERYAPELLVRKTYETGSNGLLRVAIWDLLVGPGRRTDEVSFPGGAVLEIRAGSGIITVDGKPSEVGAGSTIVVDEGLRLVFDNAQSEQALSIRAVVVSSAGRETTPEP